MEGEGGGEGGGWRVEGECVCVCVCVHVNWAQVRQSNMTGRGSHVVCDKGDSGSIQVQPRWDLSVGHYEDVSHPRCVLFHRP